MKGFIEIGHNGRNYLVAVNAIIAVSSDVADAEKSYINLSTPIGIGANTGSKLSTHLSYDAVLKLIEQAR